MTRVEFDQTYGAGAGFGRFAAVGAAALLAIALSVMALVGRAEGENWPQWRGPQGTGVSGERDLPLAWTSERGILWRTELPEWGNSTPAIWGESIFVTTQRGEDLLLLKLSKRNGKIEWTRTVGSGSAARMPLQKKTDSDRKQQKFHDQHNLASPSPVTDGRTVVVHFGNGDLAAYDFSGEQLWKRNLQEDHGAYTIWWGHANSPVIHGNMVISACMQDSLAGIAEPLSPSYVVAHDLRNGKVKWFRPRMTGAKAEECDSYTTPLVRSVPGENESKVEEIVVMGGNHLDAYNPADGSRRWFLPNLVGGRTVTGPTMVGELVFATIGMRGSLVAVRPEGEGEVPRSKIEWRFERGTPDSCSPVASERWLFAVTDDGIARCFDLETGRVRWNERLKGSYKASPVAADGRVYFVNMDGLCTVVSASDRFNKLSESEVGDEVIASPAISDGRLFFRGRKGLYCIGKD